jgi:hypothetical protein
MLKTNVKALTEKIVEIIESDVSEDIQITPIGDDLATTTYIVIADKKDPENKLLIHNINELVVQYCILNKNNILIPLIKDIVKKWVETKKVNPVNIADSICNIWFKSIIELIPATSSIGDKNIDKIVKTLKVMAGSNPLNLKLIIKAFDLFTSNVFTTKIINKRIVNMFSYKDTTIKEDFRFNKKSKQYRSVPITNVLKDQNVRFPKMIPSVFDVTTEHASDIERISKVFNLDNPLILVYACILVKLHNTIPFMVEEYRSSTLADEESISELLNLKL